MADIQVVIETVGQESLERAVKTTDTLKNRVNFLANSMAKGQISANQFVAGVEQIATKAKVAGVSSATLAKQIRDYGNSFVTTTNKSRGFLSTLKQILLRSQATADAVRMNTLAMNQFGVQASRAQVKFKRFGSVGLQQVGYQVGDFAVQVQGGTNALVALGQQGSQLLGILGPMGAIAGAALAIWTAVARVKQETSSTGLIMERVWSDVKMAIEPVLPIFKAIQGAIASIGDAIISFGNLVLNNMERAVYYSGALVTVLGVKLVAAWVASGAAAAGFFRIVRLGLVTTGLGIIAVVLGEIAYRTTIATEKMGGFGKVGKAVADLLKNAFDVVVTTLRLVGSLGAEALIGLAIEASELELKLADFTVTVANGFTNLFLGILRSAKEIFFSIGDIIVAGIKSGLRLAKIAINDFLKTIVLSIKSVKVSLSNLLPGENTIFDWDAERAAMEDFFDVGGIEGGLTDTIKSTVKEIKKVWSDQMASEPLIDRQKYIDNIKETLAKANKLKATQMGISEDLARILGATIGLTASQFVALTKAIEDADKAGKSINIEDWFGPTTGDSETPLGSLGKDIDDLDPKLTAVQQKVKDIVDAMGKGFSDFFNGIVDGTKTVADSFKSMARSILQQLWDILVVQQIVGSFTYENGVGSGTGLSGFLGSFVTGLFGNFRGNAFNNGSIVAMANGGIVGSPTLFPMSGSRTGLMGEAGPEAIMPLKRTRGGDLGVSVEGGGDTFVINQSFNLSANGDESVKRIIAEAAPQISKLTQKDIINARRRGGTMKATFG